jgi:hypothetical protein
MTGTMWFIQQPLGVKGRGIRGEGGATDKETYCPNYADYIPALMKQKAHCSGSALVMFLVYTVYGYLICNYQLPLPVMAVESESELGGILGAVGVRVGKIYRL